MYKLTAAIAVMLLFVVFMNPASGQQCRRPANRPFRVFDAVAYTGKPDLRRYGLEPIRIIDRGIWGPGVTSHGPPDPALVRARVEALPNDGAPIVLDFEDFNLTGSDREAKDSLAGLERIVGAFRSAAPGRSIGFYGILPLPDYWHAVKGKGSKDYAVWQRQNDRVAPLAANVDILFPSIYTFYPDQDGWIKYAEAQICEARRLSSKPVYVFLWPDYHTNGGNGAVRPIEGAYWRRQLDLARRLADGVVIWGGWNLQTNRPQTWNPRADWWQETLRFMR